MTAATRSPRHHDSADVRARDRFVRLELVTPSPVDAAVYYEWLLGLSPGRRPGDALQGAGVQSVRGPDVDGRVPGWIPVFRVESVEEAIAASREAGVAVHTHRDESGLRRYVEDVAGVWTGLTESAVEPIPYWTTNVDYSALDVEGTVSLLSRLLGVRALDVIDDPYDMRMLVADRRIAAGVFRLHGVAGFSVRPFWIAYFGVDDLALHVARAAESGSRVLIPPARSPFNSYAVLQDPWGQPYGLSSRLSDEAPGQFLRDATGLVDRLDSFVTL